MSTRPIDQFMWGFQPHFRRSVEYDVQGVLSTIGLQADGKIEVILVGIANRDGLRHEICIEPETGPLVVDDLRSIRERAQEIRDADPESQVFHTVPEYHEARQSGLYLRSRASAVSEAIEASGKFDGLKFHASSSTPVGDYDVHTCLGIPYELLESVPRFNNPKRDDYHGRHTEESFVEAIINTCLGEAKMALYLPNPGQGLMVLGDRDQIIRGSADRFVQGINMALPPEFSGLFDLANAFSSLTYERSGAKGQLAITNPDNLVSKLRVTFQQPIRLSEARSVRKLLELTGDQKSLLADGGSIHGLGECNSAPDVAKIVVEGHASWSLSIDDTPLIRVAYEHATLPKQIIDKDFFRDIAERTVGAVEVERIWEVFQCALDNGHGTTIVVSKDPVAEVKRLGQQALAIKPEYLDHNDVAALGRVDGAIVLGPGGRCHAFGVILDGMATSSGDRARGARFNSSVRYQRTSEIPPSMVIVISDDGTVDLLPVLMRRISRQEVEDAVQAFCEHSEIEDNDGEEWARRDRRVEELRFYLSEEQCERANESYEKEMQRRFESGWIRLDRNPLRPNPDMNDTYFWDD